MTCNAQNRLSSFLLSLVFLFFLLLLLLPFSPRLLFVSSLFRAVPGFDHGSRVGVDANGYGLSNNVLSRRVTLVFVACPGKRSIDRGVMAR